MGPLGRRKQELQSRGRELTSAISDSMPRWFDKWAEDFPEIHDARRETWCYFTGIAATFFTTLVLRQQECTQCELDSVHLCVLSTLPRLLPKCETTTTQGFLDRIRNENALRDAYGDCQNYFGLECPRLEEQGVEHDLIAPSVLGAWVTKKVEGIEGRTVASEGLSKTIGGCICRYLGEWWESSPAYPEGDADASSGSSEA